MKIKKVIVFKQVYQLFEDSKNTPEKEFKELETLFDESQNIIRETKYLEDGSVDEMATFKYDANKRLTEEKVVSSLSEGEDRRVLEYDDASGTVTDINYYGEEPGEKTITKRNKDGDITDITRFDEEGNLTSETRISYFKPGLVLIEEELDETGNIFKRVSNVYDEKDQIISQEIMNEDEEPPEIFISIARQELTETTTAVDKEEEILYTHTRFFNKQGQLEKLEVNGPDSEYSVYYEYHTSGKPGLQEIRDAADNLIRRHEFTYNDKQQLSQEILLDNQAYMRENTHIRSRYEYDYFESE